MITNLHIKNIGIIEEIEINLNSNLNVITGETGAGKSLIISAINIITGGRFSKDMLRKDATNAFVEICFYLPKEKNSIDGNIIVSREIHSNGRNLCRINGRMVTVNELKEFMKKIIEIHGQNDNQVLMDTKEHLSFLDNYIGKEISILKQEYKEYYLSFINIRKELKDNFGDEKERQRKLDLLKYQLNEIENANLIENEEENLTSKQKLIQNSEKIVKALNDVDLSIGENAISLVESAITNLKKIAFFDNKYSESLNNLENTYYELQEIARDISDYKEDVNFDEEEQKEIETRLDLIFDLKRKYGNSIQDILTYKIELEKEIYRIENLEEYTIKLKKQEIDVKERLNVLADKMHQIREKKAIELSSEIEKNLQDLEMKNAKINIQINFNENEYYENGKDKVIFLVKTNMGEDEKELNKIASGGEISRIMLAIKTVLADTDKVAVLIFDEIDTGISGKAANAVAEKLNFLGKNHQILCISHLPSIAAIADFNYFISKNISNNRTATQIKQLNEQEVVKEIARISSGEINETTLKYAQELRLKKIAI